MRIINLIEDTKGQNNCVYEHGLSFYIETENHKLLFDTGASEKFIENAKMLGIDLTKVDTVIISHGHYDHTGGILAFAEINPDAKIYIQNNAKGAFYNCREEKEKYIGMHPDISTLKQVIFQTGEFTIDKELSVYSKVTERKLWPKSNEILKEKCGNQFVQDTFLHEQYLVINEKGNRILLSGCAHNGILNILEKYEKIYSSVPDVVISGFHMMKKGEYNLEEIETIKKTGWILKKKGIKFYTGHCTGEKAIIILKEIMGENLFVMHSGDTILG